METQSINGRMEKQTVVQSLDGILHSSENEQTQLKGKKPDTKEQTM